MKEEKQCVLFETGTFYTTEEAMEMLSSDEMKDILRRHEQGDWGHINDCDRQRNHEAVTAGGRVFSEYWEGNILVWVITEPDRRATSLFMPTVWPAYSNSANRGDAQWFLELEANE